MALGASQRLHDVCCGRGNHERFALAVLALASGVYTYLASAAFSTAPRRRFLRGDHLFGPRFPSVSTPSGPNGPLYPHGDPPYGPGRHAGVRALGAAMIIAMSSWLNAAALAGFRRARTASCGKRGGYTADLTRRIRTRLAAQSLLPDIQRASERFAPACRFGSGNRERFTGTTGPEAWCSFCRKCRLQMKGSGKTVSTPPRTGDGIFNQGRSGSRRCGAGFPRRVRRTAADQFLLGSGGAHRRHNALGQTSIAPSIRRAADEPCRSASSHRADGGECRSRQSPGPGDGDCRASVAAQSKVLSEAADEILRRAPVAERRSFRFRPPRRYCAMRPISFPPGQAPFHRPAAGGAGLHSGRGSQRHPQAGGEAALCERITAAELLQGLGVQRAVDGRMAGNSAT